MNSVSSLPGAGLMLGTVKGDYHASALLYINHLGPHSVVIKYTMHLQHSNRMRKAQMSMLKRTFFFFLLTLGFFLFFVFLPKNPLNYQHQAFQQPHIYCIPQNTTQTPPPNTTTPPPAECPPSWKIINDDWRVSLLALNKPTNRIGIKPQWSTLPEFLQSCDDFTYVTINEDPEGGSPSSSPLLPSSSSSAYQAIFSPLLTNAPSSSQPLDTAIVLDALKHTASLPTSAHWDSELPPSSSVPCTRWKYSNIRQKILEETTQSPPRVAILMVTDNSESDLAKQSIAQKQQYVDKLNQKYHRSNTTTIDLVVRGHLDTSRYPTWSKIIALLSLFPAYDWIWMVDLDTIIMDMNFNKDSEVSPSLDLIEDFLDPRYDALFGVDTNGLNSGSVFFKTSVWNMVMLVHAWRLDDVGERMGSKLTDNAAFHEIYRHYAALNRAKLVPNGLFNSYPEEAGGNGYQEGDFLIHLAGVKDKGAVFGKLWDKYKNDR